MTAGATGDLAGELAAYVDSQSGVPLRLVEVAVDTSAADPVLRGRVLTPAQAVALDQIARRHAATAELEVIGDPELGLEQGWLAIAAPVVEVWRDPARMGEDHNRQTEYVPNDGPLRLLGRLPGALLGQGPDLTIGWVSPDTVQETDEGAGQDAWRRRVRAVADEAVAPAAGAQAEATTERLLATGREALGVPYRWGGTTPAGYDCSGLVQRLFATTTGVLLPKFSGDQRHVGERVTEPRAGDLLFATPKGQRVGHVMLVTSPETVLHACRTEARVIEETIAANAERYQHQGYRRPVQLG